LLAYVPTGVVLVSKETWPERSGVDSTIRICIECIHIIVMGRHIRHIMDPEQLR